MQLLHVLCIPEICALVLAFQDGVPQDMLPLKKLKVLHVRRAVSRWKDVIAPRLDEAATLLRPWLAIYGTARLPLLFHYIPRMESTVVYFSVYVHDRLLLDFLTTQYPHLVLNFSVVYLAARLGSLEILQYLHAAGLDFDLRRHTYPLERLSMSSNNLDVIRFCKDMLNGRVQA
ncbi:Aste57867_12316 [Aphanomyces stellatus]|uniref:Aste57867_12316 protein n=1 Tax=Aphanomyces stellatus TaxID=120398 RepID=A0A485KWM1_9STRA|nr:hypothetical protein As57867_012270 [Aphanomyces stellatus]VFT89168.1 Aste57867_12316 [Aphanomyces stellatus]